ncbi:hypothetical protein L3Q82_003529 [Scortum barcoo]|uniref:Uncharacterized protein n=1 Tax=Scortum barcoo TaxID=214431 RepID=A0ACB8VMG8_9TELE|nr:hypothetical protein L3Q82_003529 [Scortum barcoo]
MTAFSLFMDYSSVFNTVIPHKFMTKLFPLGFNFTLCDWLLDFLTGSLSGLEGLVSGRITVNTGTPQGCVEVASLVEWRDRSNLSLTTDKTKEMVLGHEEGEEAGGRRHTNL